MTRFAAEHIDSVREFNYRIAQGGWGEFQLPCESAESFAGANGPSRWECWLALHDGVVRGGYQLKHLEFSFHGDLQPAGFYNLSLSEGVIDRAYSGVSLKMAMHAMMNHPLLFALGMGGAERPLPRFLKSLGWDLYEVPFLFYIQRPAKVLRSLRALRTTPFRRLALDLAAATGVGAAGVGLLQMGKRLGRASTRVHTIREVASFGGWADGLWNECKGSYAMTARRDSQELNALYPPSFERITRLRIESGGGIAGWAIVRNTRQRDHKHFGDLHLGSIVDCLALDADAPLVVEAATRFLKDLGVDLIVTNQTHRAWRSALEQTGYLQGPSNFALAISGPLSRLVGPLKTSAASIHINRGDGDGPVHL